ncbi:MAG: hypothetical protein CEN91_116 [Candidatus Berkelbacteria bacterium Licking1014_85]|uniref:TraC-like domain-containing protein n=1 Tax=Candidatus Berkelbacteria bacterium Licking1014_85 TaxID=2017148 RepID=A0A554LLN3_9BACT|nr:MAG: hypothetical protein CEN91_116 [Candidatus Berkelbacteria bacterium Licking1014_85]
MSSTQSTINIKTISNGTIITNDNRLVKILEVKPVNFALKSEEDKNALIGQFQSFLNSLSFPLQILVQSRKIDIAPYLNLLKEQLNKTQNNLMRLQISEYINFIDKLTELANIMDKKFYAIVSYTSTKTETKGFFANIFGNTKSVKMNAEEFTENSKKLEERVSVVTQGLSAMELVAAPLQTQKIIETFYAIYNPDEALEEHLVETSKISSPIVSSEDKKIIAEAMRKAEIKTNANKLDKLGQLDKLDKNKNAKPATNPPTTSK